MFNDVKEKYFSNPYRVIGTEQLHSLKYILIHNKLKSVCVIQNIAKDTR